MTSNIQQVLRSIAVDPTDEEIAEFFVSTYKEKFVSSKLIRTGALIFFAALALALVLVDFIGGAFISLFICLLVGAWDHMSIAQQHSFVRQLLRKTIRYIRGKQSVTLTGGGVQVDGHDGSLQMIPWQSVIKVIEEKRVLAIITGLYSGVLVPRRAFPDDASYQHFREFAELQLETCRSGKAPLELS